MSKDKIAGIVICALGFAIIGYALGGLAVVGVAIAMWGYELQMRGAQ